MRALPFATLIAALPTFAAAHDYTLGDLTIAHPVIGESAPLARTGAGYMEITNSGDVAARLIAVEAEFRDVMLHETQTQDGMNMMVHQEDGVVIAAGETVTFRPGGLHVMFMGLEEPFTVGEEVPGVLVFEQGRVEIMFNVEPLADIREALGGEAMDHSAMGHDSDG